MMKKIFNHSLFKNASSLGFIKLLDIIFPLITIPYLTRTLDINSFGLLVISIAIYNIANIITDFGFGLSSPYYISLNKQKKELINRYLSSVLTLKSILLLISTSFLYIYFLFFNTINISFYNILFIILVMVSLSFQCQWFFVGIEKIKNITIYVSISKLSYFIMLFIFITIYKSINSVLLATATSNFLATYFYIKNIKKEEYTIGKLNKKYTLIILKQNFGFFLSRISVSLSTTLNGFLIGIYLGVNSSALYGAAERLYNAGIGLMSPITGAIYPYMARTKNARLLFIIALSLTIPAIAICVIVYKYSYIIIPFIFGSKYYEAHSIFNYFLILVPINIVSILYGYSAFSIINKPFIANYTVIFSSIVYILAIFILIICNLLTVTNILYSIIFIDTITLLLRISIFLYFYKRLVNVK
ncbi:oligosaccharide flippase family protein [Morganella morganii]|nr:oligosaccharide flippase family protein [Morganella morganii]